MQISIELVWFCIRGNLMKSGYEVSCQHDISHDSQPVPGCIGATIVATARVRVKVTTCLLRYVLVDWVFKNNNICLASAGAANQLHGGVGPNQHLLQGSVPGGGANMGMAQYPFPMQPGELHLLGARGTWGSRYS